jgi:hypothetical protein
MKAGTALGTLLMALVLALPANAGGMGGIQQYFSDTAGKVKATDKPVEKRAILNDSFDAMAKALETAQGSASLSHNDVAGIERIRAMLQDKRDELDGVNGYVRVPDEALNAFSDYVVQDMEQADEVVTISLVALLLIIILIVLLL